MNALRATTALLCALNAGAVTAADGFAFDMPEPRLRIVVPDVPPLTMAPHPEAATLPAARWIGADAQGHVVSLFTPAAGASATPRDCVHAAARDVDLRLGVDPRFVVTRQLNDTTWTLLFPMNATPMVHFHAILVSAHGTQCIEARIVRAVRPVLPEDLTTDLRRWMTGFGGARIEPR